MSTKTSTIVPAQEGDILYDTSEKIFPDIQAEPGQKATVTVDTYPDIEWHGVVESVSPAAAQEFSLLPAQNTSGNWVKVVQRVPMRISIDTSDKNLPPLRAGMSVVVDVDTGHARGFPSFLKSLFGHGYIPRTQPDHVDFPADWVHTPIQTMHRSIFVGSRSVISAARAGCRSRSS